jgi:hypothetical protein
MKFGIFSRLQKMHSLSRFTGKQQQVKTMQMLARQLLQKNPH